MNTLMRLAKQLIYDVLLIPYIYIADIVSVIKEFPSNMSASRYICDVTIQQNGKYIQHDKLKKPGRNGTMITLSIALVAKNY